MPGQVVDVFIADGDSVEKGQKLLILEAMKMQTAIVAPFDGVLEHLSVAKGDQVSDGQLLLRVAPRQAE
jgi:3-methylcrotonyl-CoA carboxylase alpha subunit